jgi:hypothetical protein
VQAVKALFAGTTTGCTQEAGPLTGYGYDEAEGASDNRSRVSSRLRCKARGRGRGRGGERAYIAASLPAGVGTGRQAEGKERVGFECQRQRAVCSSLTVVPCVDGAGPRIPCIGAALSAGRAALGRKHGVRPACVHPRLLLCVRARRNGRVAHRFPDHLSWSASRDLASPTCNMQWHWERHVLAACETCRGGHGIMLLKNRLLFPMQTSRERPYSCMHTVLCECCLCCKHGVAEWSAQSGCV